MDKVLDKIQKSSFKERIILTGYISEKKKQDFTRMLKRFFFHHSMRVLEFRFWKVLVMVYRLLLLKILHCRSWWYASYIILNMSCRLRELEECMKKILGLSEADRMFIVRKRHTAV